MSEPRRVVVVAPNWLGDAIMASPAIAAIAAARPTATITLVGRPWLETLLPWLGIEAGYAATIPQSDEAWLLRHSPRAMLAARWRARRTIGSRHRLGRFLLHRPIRPGVDMRKEHHRRYFLDLVRRAGIEVDPDAPARLVPPPGALEHGRRLLAEAGLDPARTILVAPGAHYGEAKRYPVSAFAHACRLLAAAGHAIAIIGADGEQPIAAALASRLSDAGVRVVDRCGKTSLADALSMLVAARGLMCNDSGLMHASAALGRPTVAIFGATDPARTAPSGPKATVLYEPAACSPCLSRRCRVPGQPCMANVLPERVATAMLERIGA